MIENLGKFAKSLRQGQTIYKVYALGDRSYMVKSVVCSRAKKMGITQYMGIDVVNYYKETDWFGFTKEWKCNSSESLSDMNALSGCNGYNHHRVFFSKKKAQKYLKICKELGYDFMGNDYDGLFCEDWIR